MPKGVYPRTKEHLDNLNLTRQRRTKASFKKAGNTFKKRYVEGKIKKNIGKDNGVWKGGRIINYQGYILIRNPEHPNQSSGYVKEHNLIIEKQIGRFLKSEEVVHHINRIRDDNRIENLLLFKNHSKHMQFHELQKRLPIY